MNSERNILKRLLEGKVDYEEPGNEELEEASFEVGGHRYSCAFGKYSCDGEPISKEDYFKAKEDPIGARGSSGNDSSNEIKSSSETKEIIDKYKSSNDFDERRKIGYQYCKTVDWSKVKPKDASSMTEEDMRGKYLNEPCYIYSDARGRGYKASCIIMVFDDGTVLRKLDNDIKGVHEIKPLGGKKAEQAIKNAENKFNSNSKKVKKKKEPPKDGYIYVNGGSVQADEKKYNSWKSEMSNIIPNFDDSKVKLRRTKLGGVRPIYNISSSDINSAHQQLSKVANNVKDLHDLYYYIGIGGRNYFLNKVTGELTTAMESNLHD